MGRRGPAATPGRPATVVNQPSVAPGLADDVRRIGLAAGLDAIGVAAAAPFEETRQHLEDRRSAGLHAGMEFTYRNPARSTEPDRIVAGARAIVVGARRYPSRRPEPGRPAPGDRWAEDGGLGGGPAADGPAGGGQAADGPAGDGQAADGPAGDGQAGERPARERKAGERQPSRAPAGDHDGPRPAGAVARYASADYYQPLRRALAAVAARLAADGWQARVVADDNALVDRAAAHRGGLGWFGKNTNLLLPGQGSWFVLGSVVTDAPLPPAAAPLADGCGACRRCLPACPTGALVAPGVLDARRCLAWLVQAPGIFPHEYRAALGGRLYGCDDCQEVCPENGAADRAHPGPGGPGPGGRFDPGPDDRPRADLLAILAADDDQLLARYGRWYIPQRQPRYLRRNALLALGNTADGGAPAVDAALRRSLADPDALIRGHAVWAAAQLGRHDLVARLADDADPEVRREVAWAGGDPT